MQQGKSQIQIWFMFLSFQIKQEPTQRKAKVDLLELTTPANLFQPIGDTNSHLTTKLMIFTSRVKVILKPTIGAILYYYMVFHSKTSHAFFMIYFLYWCYYPHTSRELMISRRQDFSRGGFCCQEDFPTRDRHLLVRPWMRPPYEIISP